ncbi:nucleolar component of the pachytene checkpoint [Castilleja foliolosa]|uniref:Pachytene checkpoint protein 2 homolog n=1 Tax=Castilleja foliolosa TaxID=1961234 RepID=A0ABD3BHN8_9LAMI
MLEKRFMSYADGPVSVPLDDTFLVDNVERICICDSDAWVENHDILLFWQVKPAVHVFQLSEEGPCEDISNDVQLASFNEWILPAKEFDGMWERLIYVSLVSNILDSVTSSSDDEGEVEVTVYDLSDFDFMDQERDHTGEQ